MVGWCGSKSIGTKIQVQIGPSWKRSSRRIPRCVWLGIHRPWQQNSCEPPKKTWLVGLYRGWIIINHYKDPSKPSSTMERNKFFFFPWLLWSTFFQLRNDPFYWLHVLLGRCHHSPYQWHDMTSGNLGDIPTGSSPGEFLYKNARGSFFLPRNDDFWRLGISAGSWWQEGAVGCFDSKDPRKKCYFQNVKNMNLHDFFANDETFQKCGIFLPHILELSCEICWCFIRPIYGMQEASWWSQGSNPQQYQSLCSVKALQVDEEDEEEEDEEEEKAPADEDLLNLGGTPTQYNSDGFCLGMFSIHCRTSLKWKEHI